MAKFRIRIEGEIPQGAATSSVRARFSPEAAEDVQGQGLRLKGLAQTDDAAEGSMPWRYIAPVEDEDAEGQSRIRGGFAPVEDEDTEGQGRIWGGFAPVEDKDAEGRALKSHILAIERGEDGELVGRYVPAEDTEGQGGTWGVGDTGDDTRGQAST